MSEPYDNPLHLDVGEWEDLAYKAKAGDDTAWLRLVANFHDYVLGLPDRPQPIEVGDTVAVYGVQWVVKGVDGNFVWMGGLAIYNLEALTLVAKGTKPHPSPLHAAMVTAGWSDRQIGAAMDAAAVAKGTKP